MTLEDLVDLLRHRQVVSHFLKHFDLLLSFKYGLVGWERPSFDSFDAFLLSLANLLVSVPEVLAKVAVPHLFAVVQIVFDRRGVLEVDWMGRLATVTFLHHNEVVLDGCLKFFPLHFRVYDLLVWNFLPACRPSVIEDEEPFFCYKSLPISRGSLLVSVVDVVNWVSVRVVLLFILQFKYFLQSAFVLIVTHVHVEVKFKRCELRFLANLLLWRRHTWVRCVLQQVWREVISFVLCWRLCHTFGWSTCLVVPDLIEHVENELPVWGAVSIFTADLGLWCGLVCWLDRVLGSHLPDLC